MSTNHGANLYELSKSYGFSKEELLDFSSNINPFGASKLAKQYVIDNINKVSIYPDVDYLELKNSISNYCSCSNKNIILGNGATELISSFIQTLNPKNSLLLSPIYSEYEKELNKIGSNIDKYYSTKEDNFTIDVDMIIKRINDNGYEFVVICNPNNPTGFTFTYKDIEKLLKSTSAFFMVDETYVEFTDSKTYSCTNLVDEFSNLFVIRGTSKFFSTPGIRLGYGLLSNEDIKNNINKNLDLWNINILASLMGEVMFKDLDFIKNTINIMTSERDFLTAELSKFSDLKVYESQGNFILCEIKSKKYNASEIREKLLSKKIIVRDCKSFDGLDEYFFRVCILKPDENRYLLNCLKDLF